MKRLIIYLFLLAFFLLNLGCKSNKTKTAKKSAYVQF
jgi:hypothetical protein